MPSQIYLFFATVILLMTLGRIVVVWRRGAKSVDLELVAAFIRLDFPAEQRDIAQKIAAGLAEIVGWAENPIQVCDLIKVLHTAYGIQCDADTTFRALVEKVAESRAQKAPQP